MKIVLVAYVAACVELVSAQLNHRTVTHSEDPEIHAPFQYDLQDTPALTASDHRISRSRLFAKVLQSAKHDSPWQDRSATAIMGDDWPANRIISQPEYLSLSDTESDDFGIIASKLQQRSSATFGGFPLSFNARHYKRATAKNYAAKQSANHNAAGNNHVIANKNTGETKDKPMLGSGVPHYATSTESSRAKQKPKVEPVSSTSKTTPGNNISSKQSASNVKCKRGGSDSNDSTNTGCGTINQELQDTASSEHKRKASNSPSQSEEQKKPKLAPIDTSGKPYVDGLSPTNGGPLEMKPGGLAQKDHDKPETQKSHEYSNGENGRKLSGVQSPGTFAEMTRQTANKFTEQQQQASPGSESNALAKSNRPGDLTVSEKNGHAVASTSSKTKKGGEKDLSDDTQEVKDTVGSKFKQDHGEAGSNPTANKAAGVPLVDPDGPPGRTMSVNLKNDGKTWLNVPQASCPDCIENNKKTGFKDVGVASDGKHYKPSTTRESITNAYNEGGEEAAFRAQSDVFRKVAGHQDEYISSHPKKQRRDLQRQELKLAHRAAIRQALIRRYVDNFLFE